MSKHTIKKKKNRNFHKYQSFVGSSSPYIYSSIHLSVHLSVYLPHTFFLHSHTKKIQTRFFLRKRQPPLERNINFVDVTRVQIKMFL